MGRKTAFQLVSTFLLCSTLFSQSKSEIIEELSQFRDKVRQEVEATAVASNPPPKTPPSYSVENFFRSHMTTLENPNIRQDSGLSEIQHFIPSLSPKLAVEWLSLYQKMQQARESLLRETLEKRLQDAKDMAGIVREACLKSTTSEELESLWIDVDLKLILHRSFASSANDPSYDWMSSSEKAIALWMKYWEFRKFGNGQQANQMLDLLEGDLKQPLFFKEQLNPYRMGRANSRESLQLLLRQGVPEIQNLASLETFISQLQTHADQVRLNERDEVNALIVYFKELKRSWELSEAGDLRQAETVFQASKPQIPASWSENLAPFRRRISGHLLIPNLNALLPSPLPPQPSVRGTLLAVRKSLYETRNFKNLLKSYHLENQFLENSNEKEIAALHAFLRAQDFHQANDLLSAVENYRKVIEIDTLLKVIKTESQNALLQLSQSHPDIVNDVNLRLVQTMKTFEKQLQDLRKPIERGFIR